MPVADPCPTPSLIPPEAPLSAAGFADLMAPLEPFEARPRLAVAVSGGAHSLALTLLAATWTAERRGQLTALTVDHGLRPESAAEAQRVAAWLAERGIAHITLGRKGPRPQRALQASARKIRYDLLGEWCRAQGVFHLLLAHHQADQAETVLLRLGKGSGGDGLAGMAAVRETAWGRILRPLLPVDPKRLTATLLAAAQPWLDDPSNADPRFDRVRIRRLQPALAAAGVPFAGIAAAATRLGWARQAHERLQATAAARWLRLRPGGVLAWEAGLIQHESVATVTALLGRALRGVGGATYEPAAASVARLVETLRVPEWPARTLSGCVLRPCPDGGGHIIREAATIRQQIAWPMAGSPEAMGQPFPWDQRFRLRLTGPLTPQKEGRIAALGRRGWPRLSPEIRESVRRQGIPPEAAAALPALWRGETLCGLAGFADPAAAEWGIETHFLPVEPLFALPFGVV